MLLELLSSRAKPLLNKVTVVVILPIFLNLANAFAWGFEGHKIIMSVPSRSFLSSFDVSSKTTFASLEHSIDTDLWRQTGTDSDFNHFFNLDYFGDYPFETVPLDEQEFKKGFGEEDARDPETRKPIVLKILDPRTEKGLGLGGRQVETFIF